MLQEFFQLLLSFVVRLLSWFGLSFGPVGPVGPVDSLDSLESKESQESQSQRSDDLPPPLLEPQPFSPMEPVALP
jgi:hypothetical protein